MKKIFSKLNIKKPYLIIGLISMLICALIGGAYGYYVHNNSDDGVVVASNFYFESDYLSENGETYTLNATTDKVIFKLKNFADELRCSENDINFVITTSGGTLSQSEGVLQKGHKNTIEITLSNLEEGQTYEVSATGTSGYTRTLKATFVVRDSEIELYKNINSDHSKYVVLTIWSKNIEGNATVIFPEGVIPDNTCKGMNNVLTSDGKFNVEINPYSSYVFRFFKDTTYDESKEFSVYLQVNGSNVEAVTEKI